jgi:hypothetical protein
MVNWRKEKLMEFRIISTAGFCLVLAIGAGCNKPVAVAPKPATRAVPASAPKKDADENPTAKEVRAETGRILDDLLAGKYDDDPSYAPIARKLKGFTSCSIQTAALERDSPQTVKVEGTLAGANREATFSALIVKQEATGRWMIGTFSGPNQN